MDNNELFDYGYILPQPLSKSEVYKLFQEVNEGSFEARDKLINHNIRLVLYEIYGKFQEFYYDKKDLVSIGNIGLIKAIDSYDLSKGYEFTTYAVRCIDNEILMFLRKLKKDEIVDSIDSIISYDKDGDEMRLLDKLSDGSNLVEDYENEEIYKIVREVVEGLPSREKQIIMLRFGFYDDRIYSQQELVEKLNISQSQVSRTIRRIVKKVGEILESRGVIELHYKNIKTKKKERK